MASYLPQSTCACAPAQVKAASPSGALEPEAVPTKAVLSGTSGAVGLLHLPHSLRTCMLRIAHGHDHMHL